MEANPAPEGHKYCSACTNARPLDQFVGADAQPRATCRTCRENNNARRRKRRKEDPAYRLLCNCRCRLYEALNGMGKAASTKELLGCTGEELKKHLEQWFEEGMTWENHGKPKNGEPTWDMDHYIPCSAFDFANEEDQRVCFWYQNIRPMWHIPNLVKKGKYDPAEKQDLEDLYSMYGEATSETKSETTSDDFAEFDEFEEEDEEEDELFYNDY